jgi:hypothetical protein
MNKKLLFILIFSSAFILRVISGYVYLSPGQANYWEYGSLAQNLNSGKGYSLYYTDGDTLSLKFTENSQPYPSAYMPPAYPVYLMPFFTIHGSELRDLTFILINSLISLIPLFLLFRLTSLLFGEKAAYWAIAIYAILPEFAISNISVGPTLLYHIGCLLLFWFFVAEDKFSIRNLIFLILVNGFMLYLRSEFILFTLVQVALIFRTNRKMSLIFFLSAFLLLVPWQLRNYLVFERIIPMTTSGGLNLYRGNNPVRPGIWADDAIASRLLQYKSDRDYEIKANELYLAETFDYISSNPGISVLNSLGKVFHLWGIYYYDSRVWNPLYLVPWIMLLALSSYGLVRFRDKSKIKIILLFLLYHTLWAAVFFALIRYQTMMKIALVPLAAYGITQLTDVLNKRKDKSPSLGSLVE